MSVEDQDRGSTARLFELQGTSMEEVHRRSRTVYTREFLLSRRAELNNYKICLSGFDRSLFRPSRATYTREFLLSCTEWDICKQLPEGFDSSVLLELEDGSKSLQDPWKRAGITLLPSSDNISCRVQFSRPDYSSSSSWVSVERSNYLSSSIESNSHGNYHSDSTRHNDVHVSACKSKDTAKRHQVTENDDYSQLRKSEDPYRPPHTYQGGRTKQERKSHSKKTVKEEMDSSLQEDTQLEVPGIAKGEQPDIKDTTLAESGFSCPVIEPPSHVYVSQLTQTNSKKTNMNDITEYVNEDKSRMTLKEDTIDSLEVPSHYTSTVIEKALPQSLMVNSDSEKGFCGKICFSTTEDSSGILNNSCQSNIVFHTIQSYELISKMEFNESLANRPFNSVRSGSYNGIPRVEEGPYRNPFTVPYDIASSLLREDNPIRTNQGITSNDAEGKDTNNLERNECTFDDMWSEIMEIIQFEQEMEYSSAAETNHATDFRVLISFPDNHNLISSSNPASSEHLRFVKLNSSNSIGGYDSEIHLPDQDSLITVDDLIAPKDRSTSIDYPISVGCSKFAPPKSRTKATDYAGIYLPDDGSLITTGDIIASDDKLVSTDNPTRVKHSNSVPPKSCSVAAGYGMSDVKNEVARQGALMTSDHAKGSATQGQEVHFHQPSLHLHNDWNSIHHETTACYPFNSFQSQRSPKCTFVDPVSIHCYHPALQWYSFPNTVNQFPGGTAPPKLKELPYPHVQYSPSQQPTNFLQHHRPTKNVAFPTLGVEKKQPFPLRHQRTAYPDLTLANSAPSATYQPVLPGSVRH